MPEGDTVYRATATLHRALAGKNILRSDFRVPALSTVDLAGYTVAEVVPRGKHLLMRLHPPATMDPAFSQPPLTLHSHLLMEGRWDLYGQGERFRRPAHTARVVLSFDGVTAVGFDIAQVKLVPTAEETQLVGHLGPDLLGTDWDAPLAIENFRAHPHRGIGEALLDQRLMAGEGHRDVAAPAGSQQGPSAPGHHRGGADPRALLGLRARRQALPALRRENPAAENRGRGFGPGTRLLLLSVLPARPAHLRTAAFRQR